MYGNPYYNQGQRFQPMPIQQIGNQPMTQTYIQPVQPTTTQVGLLGKSVESMDVVKAMDIPLDGSISYFPLTDGSAIVTKQLQNDGTSKIVVYKPEKEEKKNEQTFVTFEQLQEEISKLDFADIEDLRDELKEIKKQLKTMKKTKED